LLGSLQDRGPPVREFLRRQVDDALDAAPQRLGELGPVPCDSIHGVIGPIAAVLAFAARTAAQAPYPQQLKTDRQTKKQAQDGVAGIFGDVEVAERGDPPETAKNEEDPAQLNEPPRVLKVLSDVHVKSFLSSSVVSQSVKSNIEVERRDL